MRPLPVYVTLLAAQLIEQISEQSARGPRPASLGSDLPRVPAVDPASPAAAHETFRRSAGPRPAGKYQLQLTIGTGHDVRTRMARLTIVD
jgi:hypothetical protein